MIASLNISAEQCLSWAKEALQNKYDAILPAKTSIKFNDGCFFNSMPSTLPKINRLQDIFFASKIQALINKDGYSIPSSKPSRFWV
jgi:G:T-mismatch repair DNA endonuclease (very short patch repair protein)